MLETNKSSFPSSFYVANVMEIFERFAWYGVYTVLALYLTSPTSQGGLGLEQSQKGIVMGVVPFFLYLFPILSGALADRYGYKRMFIISFLIMCPSYYLLGYLKDMWSFTAVFMLVALGAGIFKPVVTGTIGKTTDDSNRGLGFGIFYMMVNIGGALGPLIAPIIQKSLGWQYVFVFAALWIACNFIPVIIFYKDPKSSANTGSSPNTKTLKTVLQEVQLVLGNARVALLVFPLLILLVAYNANLIADFGGLSPGWVTFNFAVALIMLSLLWDWANHKSQRARNLSLDTDKTAWYLQKMQLGNKPFVIYLIIMSGFWTVYLQLFITLPSYVRDFVDTSDLVSALQVLGPWISDSLVTIDTKLVTQEITRLAASPAGFDDTSLMKQAQSAITALDIRVPIEELKLGLTAVNGSPELAEQYAINWSEKYKQLNPGTLLGLDFIMIVFFQIIVSSLIKRWKVLPTLIVGTATLTLGLWISGQAHNILLSGSVVAIGIIIFATGEMIASPKSQEYVASFAPQDKVAMFMGYYFVALALGNLFAGLLSGWIYQNVAIDMNNPGLMWTLIASLGMLTCAALYVFNNTMTAAIEQQQLAQRQALVSEA